MPEEVSGALKKIKSTIHCKLIEESQNDQCKKYSVFGDLAEVFTQLLRRNTQFLKVASRRVCSYCGLRFSNLMTSQLDEQETG